jgi:hypothetical protein
MTANTIERRRLDLLERQPVLYGYITNVEVSAILGAMEGRPRHELAEHVRVMRNMHAHAARRARDHPGSNHP